MSASNRLIREKSPYLLQHAHNPVDWYPWGEEAFEAARRQNKPVFLSIGYSTCHWCHVMAHESFESPDVAEILNANFISIKVDREERPDIDHIYMTAVSSMTGQGGWPLSAFLTPEKHPFFGGTYFPPFPRWGTPGFINVLESVLKAWNDQRDQIQESAAGIVDILSERSKQASQQADVSTETLDQGFFQLGSRYDRVHGGFGQSPKFPSAHQLMFLMRYGRRTGREEALTMSTDTLLQMIRGGIYDHLGGGFHRYATDRQWQIPHFEKMLYDQAMISRALLEAYQITKDDVFAEAARATFDYVLRDLTSPSGGFYSAEDADSMDPYDPDVHEKKEGAFYLWKQTEIIDVLGQDDAFVFNTYYQINQDGNAHSDPHGEFEGKNIIFTTESVQQTAERTGRSAEDVQSILQRSRKKLLDVRSRRQRPHLDDKILTDWNGLMIASLAFGARILKDDRYAEAAVKAADFILTSMTRDSRLLHRWRDGEAGIHAGLDDYAFFVYGLMEMYQTSLDVRFLAQAKRLTDEMIVLFTDEERGGFYLSSKDADDLPFRPKSIYDGAIPSGSSIAVGNLVKLFRITSDARYDAVIQKLFQSCAGDVRQAPMGHAQLLIGLMGMLGPCKEIVIASAPDGLSVDDVLDDVAGRFLPEAVIIGDSRSVFPSKELLNICPWADHHEPVGGQTTVYVCDRQSCQAPMTTLAGIDQVLS